MATTIYGYDKNTNYQKLINEAVKAGDYTSAAIYEAQRNEKIDGEGIAGYDKTNHYASYLPSSQSSGYQKELDEALQRLTNAKFEWNEQDDAAVSAYKKAYLREADRSMRDTLGQYSTMTGGIPSTQAVAAASQAADYYKSQLADKIPELRSTAYAEWLQGQQLEQNNINMLMQAESAKQSAYNMRINEALTRWQQLGTADEQVAAILGVAVGTPTSSQSYQNWQQEQQGKSDAYTMAMTLLQAGQMPSADTLAAAGIAAEDANALLKAYTTPVYSGGGGGGKRSSGSGKALTSDIWDTLAAKAQAAGNPDAVTADLAKYAALGYDTQPFYTWLLMYGLTGAQQNDGTITGGYTSGQSQGRGGGSGYAGTIVRNTQSVK